MRIVFFDDGLCPCLHVSSGVAGRDVGLAVAPRGEGIATDLAAAARPASPVLIGITDRVRRGRR